MQKEWIKWCKETHASFYATIDSLGQWKKKPYENFKVLKFWDKRLQGKWFLY